MDSFIINALLAGVGVAFISGLLGCFVIWRRMSYFGDSLGHSAILGVGAGILIGLNQNISIILVILLFSAMLTYMQSRNIFSNDSILGILAHGAMSFGVIMVSISHEPHFDLHSLLFGDILLVNKIGIISIIAVAIIIYIFIILNWKSLILATINRDLARSNNDNIMKMDMLLTICLAITKASCIKIIGVLLITSMLIIPAAAARQISSSPFAMAISSVVLALISVFIGILSSYHFDLPAGPAIVAASFMVFMCLLILKKS